MAPPQPPQDSVTQPPLYCQLASCPLSPPWGLVVQPCPNSLQGSSSKMRRGPRSRRCCASASSS
ncbi:hypothetical protein ACE6H2_023729 [Prunus campanulata]